MDLHSTLLLFATLYSLFYLLKGYTRKRIYIYILDAYKYKCKYMCIYFYICIVDINMRIVHIYATHTSTYAYIRM